MEPRLKYTPPMTKRIMSFFIQSKRAIITDIDLALRYDIPPERSRAHLEYLYKQGYLKKGPYIDSYIWKG